MYAVIGKKQPALPGNRHRSQRGYRESPQHVMVGLVPAIHAFARRVRLSEVSRNKSGHGVAGTAGSEGSDAHPEIMRTSETRRGRLVATVDHSDIRGLVTARLHFVAELPLSSDAG